MSEFIFTNCSAIAVRAGDVVCYEKANHIVVDALQEPENPNLRKLVITQISDGAGNGETQTVTIGRTQQMSRRTTIGNYESRARRPAAFIDTTATEVSP